MQIFKGNREKEILRKQLKLLSEDSQSAIESDLANLSIAMCKVYERLHIESRFLIFAFFLVIIFDSLVSFVILIKKFFW